MPDTVLVVVYVAKFGSDREGYDDSWLLLRVRCSSAVSWSKMPDGNEANSLLARKSRSRLERSSNIPEGRVRKPFPTSERACKLASWSKTVDGSEVMRLFMRDRIFRLLKSPNAPDEMVATRLLWM